MSYRGCAKKKLPAPSRLPLAVAGYWGSSSKFFAVGTPWGGGRGSAMVRDSSEALLLQQFTWYFLLVHALAALGLWVAGGVLFSGISRCFRGWSGWLCSLGASSWSRFRRPSSDFNPKRIGLRSTAKSGSSQQAVARGGLRSTAVACSGPSPRQRWIWAGRTIVRWIRIRRAWGRQGQALQGVPFRHLWSHLACRQYGRPTWATGISLAPPAPQKARAAPALRSRVFKGRSSGS